MITEDKFIELLKDKTGIGLDDDQRKALYIKENAVIAAGAGSGKTRILATRFAWLIMTGQAKVEEILTLTFTKKAAAEMYQRIYKTLIEFEKNENLGDEERKNIKEALSNFANAHIQTLDSFCGSIVRQNASKFGIRPDFTTGSADASMDIKTKAFRFILKNKNEIGIQTFAEPGKLQDFAEQTFGAAIEKFTSIATEENYFISKLKVQLAEVVKAWNYYIKGIEDESYTPVESPEEDKEYLNLENIFGKISDIKETTSTKLQEKQNIKISIETKTNITETDKGNLKKALNVIKKSEDILSNIDEIEKIMPLIRNFSTLKVSDFTDPSLDNYEEIKIEDFSNQLKVLKEFLKFASIVSVDIRDNQTPLYYSIIAFIENYKALISLNKLFDTFLLEINSSKRTSGNLSFNDVTQMAIKTLIEIKEVREEQCHAFKKIMIDEFQDNNGSNRDLLYLISLKDDIDFTSEKFLINQIIEKDENGNIIKDHRESGKLFFVGDEKQSIYKFRGADVSVFNELKNDGNALQGMSHNYRSDPELVALFNNLFKNGNGIFQAKNEEDSSANPIYEAFYDHDAVPKGECNPITKENIPIHVALLKNFNDDEKKLYFSEKDQIAYNIAKKIYEMGHEKKNWKDFAILEKSRTDAGTITKYLNLFNIPYTIDQFNDIFDEGIINDFYNFFRLCVYPSDVHSYASYLTSPLCGLNENSVELILSHLTSFANDDKENSAIISEINIKSLRFYICDVFSSFKELKKVIKDLTCNDKILLEKLTASYNAIEELRTANNHIFDRLLKKEFNIEISNITELERKLKCIKNSKPCNIEEIFSLARKIVRNFKVYKEDLEFNLIDVTVLRTKLDNLLVSLTNLTTNSETSITAEQAEEVLNTFIELDTFKTETLDNIIEAELYISVEDAEKISNDLDALLRNFKKPLLLEEVSKDTDMFNTFSLSEDITTFISALEKGTIIDAIEKELTEEELKKYINALDFYKRNKKKVLQEKITTTLSYLWNNKGYKYETYITEKAQLIAEHFDMFFEFGRQVDDTGKNLSWFVDQLAIIKNDFSQEDADINAKDVTYPYEKQDAVNIMTIHKSKGLEFTNVFIYGCIDAKTIADKLKVFFNEITGVSIKPDSGEKNYFSLIDESKFKKEELAEFRRLIYVAITRAISSVYIYGKWSPPENTKSKIKEYMEKFNLHIIEKDVLNFYMEEALNDNSEDENEETLTFFNEEAAFDFTKILPIPYEQLKGPNEIEQSVDELRENIKNNNLISDTYKNTEGVIYESNPITRRTPSSLEPSEEEKSIQNKGAENEKFVITPNLKDLSTIEIGPNSPFKNMDELKEAKVQRQPIDDILSLPYEVPQKFTAAEFGTLAHAYEEALVNGVLDSFKPDNSLVKNLSDDQIEKLEEIGKGMCKNFKESRIGNELFTDQQSKFYKAEWQFKMFYDDAIFNGSMDLIYQNDDKNKYTIVDYKTDRQLDPSIYVQQQHCYRTAAANLLSTKEHEVKESDISLYLYYLRYDIIVKLD